jgi:hypothetical protein
MTVATPSDALEQIRARAGELLAHDRWSRAEVLAYQRERLQELVRTRSHTPRTTGRRWVPTHRSARSIRFRPFRRRF